MWMIFQNGTNEVPMPIIRLAVVACDQSVPQAIVLLKTALMYSSQKIHFYIFTELKNNLVFIEQVNIFYSNEWLLLI